MDTTTSSPEAASGPPPTAAAPSPVGQTGPQSPPGAIETTPGRERPGADTPATGVTAEPPADPYAQAADLDPDELIRRHRKLAGRLGDLAQRQAQQIAERQQALAKVREEEDRRKRLRDEDPYEYAQLDKKREEELARTQATWSEFDAGVLYRFFEQLPESVQAKVSGKVYDGSPTDSRLAYLREVVDGLVEHETNRRVAQELARREKEFRASAKKEALSEVHGKEPSPDVGTGDSVPRLTRAALGEMSPAEYAQNRDRILDRMLSRRR